MSFFKSNYYLIILSFSILVITGTQSNFALSAEDEFAINVLKEAEALARKLPQESQAPVIAKIAAEYQRLGRDTDAKALWSELEEEIQKSDDQSFRDSVLTVLAKQRMRSGDFEKAKALAHQIEHPPTQYRAIGQIARVLCDQAKFKEAVVFAESIPRSSGVLFDTMEEIGLAAAEGGDTNAAARASRGMNPGQGGSMARKLRAVSKMCNSYWKTGNEKSAIAFMGQGKKFSDIMKLDLESTLVIDTTWAALQADDFEAEVEKLLARLVETEVKVDKNPIRLAMATVVLGFDKVDLIKHFRNSNDQKSYVAVLDLIVAHHLAESGKTEEAIEAIKKIELPILAAEGFVKLSQFHLGKNLDVGKEHLLRAKPHLIDYLKKESQPDHFWRVFEDYLTASVLAGQRVDALALVKQVQNTAKAPDLMLHIIAAKTDEN